MYKIIQDDCLKILPTLPKAKMIWADPPDNIGAGYIGFNDKQNIEDYYNWLDDIICLGSLYGDIFWFSHNIAHLAKVIELAQQPNHLYRLFLWHYTFGQNNQKDFTRSFRPILRILRLGAQTFPDAVRVPSTRQLKYKDKRANPKGKLPDDVWEFPRICGTFKERKIWHPCQHPKELLKRMVLFSTKPKDLVIDIFAGSGNMIEVCQELDRYCIGIDISKFYCKRIAEETGAELINDPLTK